ncbi:MAG: hypothetical protein AVDCRST_MAG40-744, partial [uncultured Gemmatimonadaceae bacterium]
AASPSTRGLPRRAPRHARAGRTGLLRRRRPGGRHDGALWPDHARRVREPGGERDQHRPGHRPRHASPRQRDDRGAPGPVGGAVGRERQQRRRHAEPRRAGDAHPRRLARQRARADEREHRRPRPPRGGRRARRERRGGDGERAVRFRRPRGGSHAHHPDRSGQQRARREQRHRLPAERQLHRRPHLLGEQRDALRRGPPRRHGDRERERDRERKRQPDPRRAHHRPPRRSRQRLRHVAEPRGRRVPAQRERRDAPAEQLLRHGDQPHQQRDRAGQRRHRPGRAVGGLL